MAQESGTSTSERDAGAFTSVYSDHADSVFRTAYEVLGERGLAEDVTQEVFLQLWRGCGYDPARGRLGAYLRLMARSRALDVYRSSRTRDRLQGRLEERALAERRPSEDPAPRVIGALERSAARGAVRRLPAPQREVVALTFWAGMTADEVAAATAIPLGTAKSRLRLALQRLGVDSAIAVPRGRA